MYKIRIGVLCLVIVFILGIAINVTGKDAGNIDKKDLNQMCVPLGIINLKPDSSVKQKKSEVKFDHSRHFIYECKVCHHKWEGKNKIANCTTSGCHDLLRSPEKPTKFLVYTKEGIKYYKYAFHKNCIGCHKEIKVKRKKMEMTYLVSKNKLPKTGPTGCKECHSGENE